MKKLGAIAYKIVAALGVLALLIFCAAAATFTVGVVSGLMMLLFEWGEGLELTIHKITIIGGYSALFGSLIYLPSLLVLGWPLSLWCRGRMLRYWLAAAFGTVVATMPVFVLTGFDDKDDLLGFLVTSLICAALTGVFMWLALGGGLTRENQASTHNP